MDKETLSNYGWIVILVLILAVMLALATPFGNFIAGAIKATTAGFFNVNGNALGSVALLFLVKTLMNQMPLVNQQETLH